MKDMGQFHDDRFPGESDDYRAARDRLLQAELDLRDRVEEVAALRRQLPQGGALKEDYVFDEGAADLADDTALTQTRFSELFAPGKDSLVVYSFMYAPEGQACPMCATFLDSFNGSAPHIAQRINLAVVAKAPIGTIRAFARQRGWGNLRLLSSGGNAYNADYHAEREESGQIPALNVFRKSGAGIHHFYNSELLYAPFGPGGNPRHVDNMWPLWNLFDLTPEGRGEDWYPSVAYD